MNQGLLVSLGVSHPSLNKVVEVAAKYNIHAKVSINVQVKVSRNIWVKVSINIQEKVCIQKSGQGWHKHSDQGQQNI